MAIISDDGISDSSQSDSSQSDSGQVDTSQNDSSQQASSQNDSDATKSNYSDAAAQIARREQQIRLREAQLDQTQKELDELRAWGDKLKQSPIDALAERGIDHAELIRAGLAPKPDEREATLQRELEALKRGQTELADKLQQAQEKEVTQRELALARQLVSEERHPVLVMAEKAGLIDAAQVIRDEFYRRASNGEQPVPAAVADEVNKWLMADLEKKAKLWQGYSNQSQLSPPVGGAPLLKPLAKTVPTGAPTTAAAKPPKKLTPEQRREFFRQRALRAVSGVK